MLLVALSLAVSFWGRHALVCPSMWVRHSECPDLLQIGLNTKIIHYTGPLHSGIWRLKGQRSKSSRSATSGLIYFE